MADLDGWRRQVIRRRSATAARHWSLITLCALLAGAAVGRLDGSPLLTAAAIGSIALVTGAMRVVRSRRVSAGEAARLLDATFGLDEQVATALCFVGDRGPGGNPLVVGLLDRAAGLVADANDEAGTRPPAYGEWVAMAVTAAAAVAVVAAPGTVSRAHPGAVGRVQGDGGARTATASATHPGSALVHATGKPTTAARAAAVASPAAASPAPGTRPGAPAASVSPASSAPGDPAPDGGAAPRGGVAPPTTGPAGSPGQHPGQAGPSGAPQPGSGPSAAGRPTGGAPGPGPGPHLAGSSPASPGAPPGRGPQAAPHATAQPGTGRRQAGTRSGMPGGDTAGTQHGTNRADGGPTRLLPNAGDRVLLIVLPGTDGSMTARSTTGAPGQRAGGSGETTVAPTAPAGTASTAAYVPPDGNELPFADQTLLGRYF